MFWRVVIKAVCNTFTYSCCFFSVEVGRQECYPGEWACPESGQCIPLGKVCDGTVDCPAGEDETNITAGRHCSEYLNQQYME